MIRKLAFALSLLGACFTGFVHALGLGEADVKSTLNQPLKAEIELVNVADLTVEEILPGLATREEFLRAGVDRVYFLSDLRFKVEKNQAGNLVVVLTTNKPVREPFLNFLVEVIWPSGRLLREYALLIDPPVFTEEKAPPVQAPVAQPIVQSGDVISVPPVRQSVSQPRSSIIEAGAYGPTTSTDTLWDIALKARPDRSVSPQQVMLAIQDLNPDAFIDQNINKMKAGQVLRLPTKDQISQRSSYQAINEVIAQNEALRPARKQAVVSASKVEVPRQQTKSATGDELKLVVSDKASKSTESASSGEVARGSVSKAVNNELALTRERLDKAEIENDELNSRLGDLEEQLETLQRLLTLKNDQLASLQQQMQANELAKLQREQVMAESKAEEDVAADAPALATAPKAESEPAKPESTKPESTKFDPEKKTPQADESKVAESKVAQSGSPEGEMAEKPANLMEQIITNPLYLAAVVVGVLLLVLIIWLVSRNNARKELEYQDHSYEEEDDVDSIPESFEEEQSFDEEPSFDSVVSDEEGFASASDEVVPKDEDEDAIAEADVYIAYGRLDQAAGILEEAISADPVRADYRLKLLEVYKESNDVESFNRQFSELEAIQDPDALEKATLIRGEMLDDEVVSLDDIEHDLLESKEVPVSSSSPLEEHEVAIEAESEAVEQEDNTFDFDSIEEDEAEELGIDLSSDELDVDLDIELPKDGSPDDTAIMPSDTVSLETVSLETDSPEYLEAEDLIVEQEDLTDDLLDAELDVALDDVDLGDDLEQESEIDLPQDLSLAADELADLTENKPELVSEELVIEEAEAGADLLVSDDILEEAVDALGDPNDFDSEIGEADLGDTDDFDFLEGTDEASTKLDLARAYIDMGDVEGARDILEEVQTEGSEEQQAEAKNLLESLTD